MLYIIKKNYNIIYDHVHYKSIINKIRIIIYEPIYFVE